MKLTYIASPYSHPDPLVREARYIAARRCVAWLLSVSDPGAVHFSPIVYCHPMALAHELPTDAAFWKDFNEGYMEHADEIYFLRIDGWQSSRGFSMEFDWTQVHRKPFAFIEPVADSFTFTID